MEDSSVVCSAEVKGGPTTTEGQLPRPQPGIGRDAIEGSKGPNVVSLQGLLDGKKDAVEGCVEAMRMQGWIFVLLPDVIRAQSRSIEGPMLKFFSSEEGGKLKYRVHPHLGYDSGANRQSLRILTGTELDKLNLPEALADKARALSSSVDEALHGVAKVLCKPLFGATPKNVGRSHQLPLLSGGQKKEAAFALLEAAYYQNDSTSAMENCAAHFDPGLFSLNVLSNQPGLEFKDHNGAWVPAPHGDFGLGVLWTGWAASNAAKAAGLPDVAAAEHHVIAPMAEHSPPRLSVWSEICTREQVFLEEFMKVPSWFGNDEEGRTTAQFGEKPTQLLVPNLIGGKPYVVGVKEGGVLDALRTVQELKGLPMSKIMKEPIYNDDGEVVGVGSPWMRGRSGRKAN